MGVDSRCLKVLLGVASRTPGQDIELQALEAGTVQQKAAFLPGLPVCCAPSRAWTRAGSDPGIPKKNRSCKSCPLYLSRINWQPGRLTLLC